MPTNRPFFANFLAAFRMHTALQKAATASQPAGPNTAKQTSFTSSAVSTNTHTSSGPRTIVTKATSQSSGVTAGAAEAAAQLQSPRQPSTSPYSRTQASPSTSGFGIGSPVSRQRRGSDSSNEGFRDITGAEKWYIGGRTATGEERFYKLGMVKKYGSADRLSMDRLSL